VDRKGDLIYQTIVEVVARPSSRSVAWRLVEPTSSFKAESLPSFSDLHDLCAAYNSSYSRLLVLFSNANSERRKKNAATLKKGLAQITQAGILGPASIKVNR
jgi:hypothetical protein